MELFQGLGHIAIRTKDVENSIAFYEKLGGRLLRRSDAIPGKLLALVDFCGVTLELIQAPGELPAEEGLIPHFAIAVADVDAAAAQLAAAGLNSFETPGKSVSETLFGGLENRFFRGPDGERIELVKLLH